MPLEFSYESRIAFRTGCPMQTALGMAFFAIGLLLLIVVLVLLSLAFKVARSNNRILSEMAKASASLSEVRHGKYKEAASDHALKFLQFGLARSASTGKLRLDEGRYVARAIDAIHQ